MSEASTITTGFIVSVPVRCPLQASEADNHEQVWRIHHRQGYDGRHASMQRRYELPLLSFHEWQVRKIKALLLSIFQPTRPGAKRRALSTRTRRSSRQRSPWQPPSRCPLSVDAAEAGARETGIGPVDLADARDPSAIKHRGSNRAASHRPAAEARGRRIEAGSRPTPAASHPTSGWSAATSTRTSC